MSCPPRNRFLAVLATGLMLVVFALVPSPIRAADQGKIAPEDLKFFEAHVRPLLLEKCAKCHGSEKQSGSLRVDGLSYLVAGGDSGPALVPGHPEESLLIEAINWESYEMPPDSKLADKEIEILTRWVKMGAPWPGETGEAPAVASSPKISEEDQAFWCFQPIDHPDVPVVTGDDWSRTEIDKFILKTLRANQLTPQPEADRLTLIRRATQIVTGLPPTPEEIDAFLSDEEEGAYERLITRLMDSPRRAEHLARFWLDVVRYAESDGYRQDAYRAQAWRYRDYVLDAFRYDKPYDLFIIEQLAGDEYAPHDPQALAATGYYRLGIYEYNQRDAEGQWKAMLEDITDTTSDVFLAMGLGCAKCHDHKFDPLLQADYYRFQSFLSNIGFRDDRFLATPEEIAEYERQLAEWEAATAELRAQIEELEAPKRAAITKNAIGMFVPELRAMWEKPYEERTAYERQIAHLMDLQAQDSMRGLAGRFKGEEKERWEALKKELEKFNHLKPKPLPVGPTVTDISPDPSPVLIPGRPRLGEMDPTFLTVLGEEHPEIESPVVAPESTGRRLALARWIASPDNPLTARVIVNRIWQQHFGTGLVATVSDFGRLGETPSHPELLDWLASEFIRHGWSIRWLQEQILLSAAFRQDSEVDTDAPLIGEDAPVNPFHVDPSNRLLWRYPVQRLGAEQIRDSMLAISGELDLTTGGPGATNSARRSVYLRVMRNRPDSILEAFDFPDRITSTGSRNTTTTPTQSLLMINSDWVMRRATALAKRVEREIAGSDDSRVRHVWRLAYGRDPVEQELVSAMSFLERQRELITSSGGTITAQAMPQTGRQALHLNGSSGQSLPQLGGDQTPELSDFTFEAIVQLDTIYPDSTVRTIASQWDSNNAHRGWSLGVTSQRSAYKPRNLILQLIGKTASGETKYEVVASNLHVELGRPYYVACRVKLDETGPEGVTFTLLDLATPDAEVQTAQAKHEVVSDLGRGFPLIIGGRHANERQRWDGLVDEVRLVGRRLADDEIQPNARDGLRKLTDESTIVGHWTFDNEKAQLADSSSSGRDLHLATGSVSDQAFLDLCHIILNSNEFLYLD